LANALSWLWLGILAHAVFTFSSGRLSTSPVFAATLASYVLAVGIAFGAPLVAPLISVLLIATPLVSAVIGGEHDPLSWIVATVAGAALGAAVLLPESPYGLEVGVALASGVLLAGLATLARQRTVITADRAVELGPALAHALNDPAFRIAVRAPEGDGWLTTSGVAMPAPHDGTGETTAISRDGIEIARITHDPSTLSDPAIRDAVITAVELEAHNVRLHADLDDQAATVALSRRRLLDAGIREREALGNRVQTDVLVRLNRLADETRTVVAEDLPGDAADRLQHALSALDAARGEIDDLARGVYPPKLASEGLVGALRDLAKHMPTDVEVVAPESVSGGPDVDATLYFLCAEALANSVRHANATSVRIDLERVDGNLTVAVDDNGVGGADPKRGTGLRGLRDRVEALGGRLEVQSGPEKGTRLVATIPVTNEAR